MSLIEKCDVKDWLSARHRKEVHLDQPASRPDATGFSVAQPGSRQTNLSGFAMISKRKIRFPAQPSHPAILWTDSIRAQAPAAPKSAEA
jgi:hypothetical protein